jgi:hypothetical protein
MSAQECNSKAIFPLPLTTVTRFCELLPFVRFYTLVIFLNYTFSLLISHRKKSCALIFTQKRLGVHFGRLFSETHLATLPLTNLHFPVKGTLSHFLLVYLPSSVNRNNMYCRVAKIFPKSNIEPCKQNICIYSIIQDVTKKILKSSPRAYDRLRLVMLTKFSYFYRFSEKNLAFFLKMNVMIRFLHD